MRIGPQDPGLLARHLRDGVAELAMVQRDGRDDLHDAVDDVGGVPAAAHADLDDADVDRRVGEGAERHRGQQLEERDPLGATAQSTSSTYGMTSS